MIVPTPGLQNVTVLGNVICNNEVIRVGLIQSAWCPYKKRKCEHRETQARTWRPREKTATYLERMPRASANTGSWKRVVKCLKTSQEKLFLI